MARPFEEPLSRLAVWARRLSVAAVIGAGCAVVVARRSIDPWPAFLGLLGALCVAGIALVLAFAAFIVIWREGNLGLGRAVTGLVLAVALLAYPAFLAIGSYGSPRLVDVSTDTADPPRFEAISRLRPRHANGLDYPGMEAARAQRAIYPDVIPLLLEAPAPKSFEEVLTVLTKARWRIVGRRPATDTRDGFVEAVARTPVMGFPEDVIVRVRPSGRGSVVDIRSASRYGGRDFGSNARRILWLRAEIEEEAGS